MPLNNARTTTSLDDGGGSRSARISPRPGATIQKARAASDDIRQFWAFCGARYNPDRVPLTLSALYPLKAVVVFAAIVIVARAHMRAHHPFARLGPANQVTMARALLVALVAGLVGEAHSAAVAWSAIAASVIATGLDGADGWLARRTRMATAFGARFDMEVDALLIQVLAILAWRHGKAGLWVLLSGLLRYMFVAAGWIWPWMQRALFPSIRRKAICIVQIVGLLVTLLPGVTPPASAAIAAASLAILSYSFLVDIVWLWRRR
jgi:phosphatidylglycerophosphate synthase